MKRYALPGSRKRITLHPGDHAVAGRGTMLSTLLGSCVAVCMYDEGKGLVGMNHFLLAERRNLESQPVLATEAGRYGIHAMEQLVNGMLQAGARRWALRAKAFGGGNVLGRECSNDDDFMCVGKVNARFVRDFLERDGIPLVAADLEGSFGRQIHFDAEDYSVYVRHIPVGQTGQVIEQERLYWRQQVDRPKAGPATVWD